MTLGGIVAERGNGDFRNACHQEALEIAQPTHWDWGVFVVFEGFPTVPTSPAQGLMPRQTRMFIGV
jgi:hypothetical protein